MLINVVELKQNVLKTASHCTEIDLNLHKSAV